MGIKWAVLFSALCVSTTLNAATLSADGGIELMALDGKEINDQTVLSQIPEGKHQVVYRYYSTLRDGSSNRLLSVTPNVSLISFKQDDHLTISLPRFMTYAQAKAYFRRSDEWSLVDAQGNKHVLAYEVLPGQGFMPYSDIEKPLAAYNLAKGNKYAPQGASKMVQDEVMMGGNDMSLLNTFKLLYNNASPQQRDAIRAWLATQK
jgi:uncharacterized protein